MDSHTINHQQIFSTPHQQRQAQQASMDDDRNITTLLLTQTFRIGRCTSLLSPTSPTISSEKLEYKIRIPLSKHLYEQYRSQLKVNDKDSVEYESYKDILRVLKIAYGNVDKDQYRIQYIQFHCTGLLPNQMFVFIKDITDPDDNFTLVLNKISPKVKLNRFIVELLEDLNHDPLIIKPFNLPNDFIPNLINQLLTKLEDIHGSMELVYTTEDKTKLLRNMIVEIRKSDLESLYTEQLYEDICNFLYTNTKIRFNRLVIERLNSSLMNLSNDGKIKFNDELDDILWYLFEASKQSKENNE